MDKDAMQRAIEEVRALSEWDNQQRREEERAARKQGFVDSDNVVMEGFVIGRLSDLPLWAAAYIKYLREKAWEDE